MSGEMSAVDLQRRVGKRLKTRVFSENSVVPGSLHYEMTYVFDEKDVGFGGIQVPDNENLLKWYHFYPYGLYQPLPLQSGLGTLTHVLTLLAVTEANPEVHSFIVTHNRDFTSYDRRNHLAAMGIDWRTPLPFPEYLERSIVYARKKGFVFE